MHKTISFTSSMQWGAIMLMLGATASGHAQTVVPDESSRPVLSPGRVGPHGAQGSKPLSAKPLEATVANVMEDPVRHANRNVVVSSTVGQVHSPWAFQLDDRTLGKGGVDNDLLVVSTEPLATMGFKPDWKNRKIIAIGTIRMVQATDFRREYGRGVDDELFRRFEGKPALIATSLKLAE